jgi:hypothetical protein
VKVSVANVTERRNWEAMFQADPLNLRDCFRDSAYGHPEIFHKGDEAVARLKSAHRWDQPSPCSKELRFLIRIIGPDIFQPAHGFAYFIDLLDLLHQRLKLSILRTAGCTSLGIAFSEHRELHRDRRVDPQVQLNPDVTVSPLAGCIRIKKRGFVFREESSHSFG